VRDHAGKPIEVPFDRPGPPLPAFPEADFLQQDEAR
jgi:hypothetical protein